MATTTSATATTEALAERLTNVARELRNVASQLDRRTNACNSCGRSSAVNLLEFKAADALNESAEKVRKWATSLRKGRDLHPHVTERQRRRA